MKDNNKQSQEKGKLYIVGTPIGNLGDITYRAVETLKLVDVILAEDTRQTLKLLNHFEIQKSMISYHRHNEDDKIERVVELLNEGKNIALVSDAGMPVISDPGQNLVKYLTQNNYTIEVIPGVTAITTAVVKSSMDSTRFTFEGFLSVNKKQRKAKLASLVDEPRTMIFYEAPHKILDTLKAMYEYFGNRNICLCRELTKIHEEFRHSTILNEIARIEQEGIKGELVLIIEGRIDNENKQQINIQNIDIVGLVTSEMNKGMSKKEAIKSIAKKYSLSKNEVYKLCLDIEVK